MLTFTDVVQGSMHTFTGSMHDCAAVSTPRAAQPHALNPQTRPHPNRNLHFVYEPVGCRLVVFGRAC